jgi:hypothetical protein
MDYFLQTPFILLANNNLPYIYVYNLPFIINSDTNIFIDNFKLNSLFPLNSNQFFDKKISPTFCKENLSNRISFQTILSYMYNLFDDLYINNPQYSNIINVLETSNNQFINLNLDLLNNTSYYGSTSQQIIKNVNLPTFSNNDYLKYNKLCLGIYDTLLLNTTIYNTPYVQYSGKGRLNNIEIYLNEIPKFFIEQITWITENQDYLLITNKINQNYSSLSDINHNIETIFFNQTKYKYKTMFNIDTNNLISIYNNNKKFNIDSYETNITNITNTFYADYMDNIKNNDIKTDIDIIKLDNDKFEYFGPIFLDSNNNILLSASSVPLCIYFIC